MYIEQIFGKKNITHKDIENLFKNVKSEHRNLELKETVTREKLLVTVTGMANARASTPAMATPLSSWIRWEVLPSR